MKNSGKSPDWQLLFSILVISVALSVPTATCLADWFEDTRLTYDEALCQTATGNGHKIVIDASGDLHVVWTDHRGGSAGIFYKRFDGVDWTEDERLTPVDTAAVNPAMAADGLGTIHVIWADYRNSMSQIYYKVFDGAWSPGERLTSDPGASQSPRVVPDALGNLHVVWYNDRSGESEIYYKRFDGSWWSSDLRLTNAYGVSEYPSITVDSGSISNIVWQDRRDGNLEIYFKSAGPDLPPPPRLTSIDPDSAYWYVQGETMTLTGENFVPGAEVRLQTAGQDDILTYDVVVVSPTELMFKLDLVGAEPGIWDVVIENIDAQRDTLQDAVRIIENLKPEIASIAPDSGYTYQVLYAPDITGAHFIPGMEAWLERSGSPSIYAENLTILSADHIVCSMWVG